MFKNILVQISIFSIYTTLELLLIKKKPRSIKYCAGNRHLMENDYSSHKGVNNSTPGDCNLFSKQDSQRVMGRKGALHPP